MRSSRDRTVASLARALKTKEDAVSGGFDELRPALTEDGTITQNDQRKALEYLVNPATLKEAPRLDNIYDFTIAMVIGIGSHSIPLFAAPVMPSAVINAPVRR